MKISNSHQLLGISLAVLFTGVTAVSLRQRIRDKRTGILLQRIKSKTDTSTTLLNVEEAFDVNYLSAVLQGASTTVLVVKKKVASSYAKQIYDAWGSWFLGGDNEAKVYAVFRKLKDKVQVAQVSKAYQELYSENLIDVLKERFSTTEIKQVLEIVAQLPNYRTIK